ncbi:MAG: glycosyltransferase family 4 protein [Actinobacteria bacterium]|nr:glycosyltransferase family 4 protein [Actinomycetota bacterium]
MIGISLLTLVPGVVGGSETYARELTRALHRVGSLEYRVFVPSIAPDAAGNLPALTVSSYRASHGMAGRVAAMGLAAALPGRIRRDLRLHELDAMHFPLTVMLPPVDDPPAATTVLDVQHEYFPSFFSRAELAYRRVVYGWTARRSRLVVAISEHVKHTLVERLRLDADRIRVIHLGVDHVRFTPGGGAREPLLVYPANRWPHKNHDRLLRAFALLRAERSELRLVLTGSGHDGMPLPEGVEARGRVSADDLADLYRRASALVFPSLYEGFGQPPLEAMASGCPVAASTAGALPEICGDAARLFDPTAPEEIAAAIADVLDDPGGYVARGLERAALFSWDACAHRHEDLYRELAA